MLCLQDVGHQAINDPFLVRILVLDVLVKVVDVFVNEYSKCNVEEI
jgi:hypothetical protein